MLLTGHCLQYAAARSSTECISIWAVIILQIFSLSLCCCDCKNQNAWAIFCGYNRAWVSSCRDESFQLLPVLDVASSFTAMEKHPRPLNRNNVCRAYSPWPGCQSSTFWASYFARSIPMFPNFMSACKVSITCWKSAVYFLFFIRGLSLKLLEAHFPKNFRISASNCG